MNMAASQVDDEILKPRSPVSFTASDCSSDDESSDETLYMEEKPAPNATFMDTLQPRMWSLLVLSALALAFVPVTVCTVIVVVIARVFGSRPPAVAPNGKTAIVTGAKMTKSFVILKQLKAQGCRVVLVDSSKYWMVASRFSRCVDRFVAVPVPEKETEAHCEAILRLVDEEKADLFVPVTSPLHSVYEARVSSRLPKYCHSWSLPADEVESLDDKVAFCEAAANLGLTAPSTTRVCSVGEVVAMNERLRQAQSEAGAEGGKQPRYILKSINYDSMRRLDLFKLPCEPALLEKYTSSITISDANPWTVQTFLEGVEHSTCAFAKDGRLLAYSDNEASISCFNYVPARNEKMLEWVRAFVAARRLSGILCIDFFVEADGTPYPIECNPRASSNITSFYQGTELGAALVNPDACTGTALPPPSAVETYWLFSEAWAALTKPGRTPLALVARVAKLLHKVCRDKDAYFDADDPLPFLALLFVHLPTLLMRNVRKGNRWAKIDPCIGKLTEENGD